MAFTGIAATLLPTGKTVHRTFGLSVPLFANSSSAIKIQSKKAQYLKETDIYIWDEAPMAPRYALEIMDRTLRDIMNNDFPFGGKIVLLGGDFRQLLPIKRMPERRSNSDGTRSSATARVSTTPGIQNDPENTLKERENGVGSTQPPPRVCGICKSDPLKSLRPRNTRLGVLSLRREFSTPRTHPST
ncbi:ATP-dependent DNA helicase pif1-like [Polyergus mexicanus]|uniref:ATP-dependent DNA helicase pif1-like n=1 Tax=Polyergus mexicanus TaxID=615972 RepID=UPI0038B43330